MSSMPTLPVKVQKYMPGNTAKPRSDGRVLMKAHRPHPIPRLMAEAEEKWEMLLARQSNSLDEAVAEYQRRYNRNPPKGFDLWYSFARSRNFDLIDEFDIIDEDLLPFRAFSPSDFRRRAHAIEYSQISENDDFAWSMTIKDGVVSLGGKEADNDRAAQIADLIEPFKQHLGDMEVWFSAHDREQMFLSFEERQRLEGLAKAGACELVCAAYMTVLDGALR